MVRTPTAAFRLAFCLTLATGASQVQAAFANLVRQYAATTDGQAVLVCVYALDGKEFERRYPAGNFCPVRVEI